MTHIGTQEIYTKRLILRRFRPEDAIEAYNTWMSDPAVPVYMRWQAMTDPAQAHELLARWSAEYDSPKRYHWAICLKNGKLIGSLGVFVVDEYDSRY